jgi:hypothetical protein
MRLPMHAGYSQLVDKVRTSHAQGRRTDQITPEDIDLARLYCYAFRIHTIGAFHATRLALTQNPVQDPVAHAHLQRADEQLDDLANHGMEPVPDDFLAVISTFHRYEREVRRVLNALEQAYYHSRDATLDRIGQRFLQLVSEITESNGLYLAQGTTAPEQASFVVPNLGITIVPLVYGDHHSWNLAYLTAPNLDVPFHRHHFGVEIHLGFEPLEGYMVLGECKAPVRGEGYALPIPPVTRHGWVNSSGESHHVPFIFGSLHQAGWGVFFDVEPQPMPFEDLRPVERDSWQMGAAVFLEREIAVMARSRVAQRRIIIPAQALDRKGSGGLELAVSRAPESGLVLPLDSFRAISVVRGRGTVRIGPIEGPVQHHDHFGVPAGMQVALRQQGDEPLVILDAVIRSVGAQRGG